MTIKLKFVSLAIWSQITFSSFAKDVGSEAEKDFDLCMKETKLSREQCSFGGCGNIVGSCYEKQISVVSSATEILVEKLNSEKCREAANSISNEMENLNDKLKLLAPFDGTWGGYDVQIEVALLKNKVMNALAKECEGQR